MNLPLVLLFGLKVGFLSGLRAFTPLALISWLAIWGWVPLAGSPLWFFGTTTAAVILSILAVGELIADKLPKTPPRTQVAPIAGRAVTGACSAAALCVAAGQPWILGVLAGVLGSVAGAFGGFHLRRFFVQRLKIPDLLVALTEDFATIAGASLLVRYFFNAPV
ncbi:MAG: putative transrane protein [Spartobacteria bacterium]|nr:putative transrane protein [Spartobacteria bacterium]